MSRLADVVRLLQSGREDGSELPPNDDVLLELVVRMAASDGVIDDAEVAMLQGVLPGWSEDRVRAYIDGVQSTTVDFDDLASRLPSDDARWTALRFAARMAHEDDRIDTAETDFLVALSEALGLGPDAVARVHEENRIQRTPRLDPVALREVLDAYSWEAADFVDGSVQSGDLVPCVPTGATPIIRVGVDAAEVLGLYAEGLVGRFAEGPAFLAWSSIIGTSRGAGLAASLRIHTNDGKTWSLVDQRLAGLQILLDRLHRKALESAPGTPPEILRAEVRQDTWDNDA